MRRLGIAVALMVAVASCSLDTGPSAPDGVTVGFIFVGARDDLGYNQAAWEGSEDLARTLHDVRVLREERVPETAAAIATLEGMVDEGATVLFATSFGHRDAVYEVARRHPDVTVLHQGGLEPQPGLPNLGTYFGTHGEALYLAGIAAGAATETGRLGFVVAFPIPATFINVNAFTLGAQSVRPDVTTTLRFTEDWCRPAAQRRAVGELVGEGVDVIAQHQDCTRPILEAAEAAGVRTVGYHSDGSEVAPTGWLVGAVWSWGPLFTDIVSTILDGTFSASPYEGDFRGSLATGDNPFILTEPGPSVSPATRARLAESQASLASGASPFAGPITDRAGRVRAAAGAVLGTSEQEAMDWFVPGVIGDAER